MACVLGTGTTFTLSTDGTVGRLISIGEYTEEIARIENDDLASVGHNKYCPGDKIEHGEIELPIVFDGDAFLSLGVTQTGTITFTDTSTLAGTGFLIRRGVGPIENNERIESNYAWSFDGDGTPPVYTAATP